jgi:hypothetical protein
MARTNKKQFKLNKKLGINMYDSLLRVGVGGGGGGGSHQSGI